MVATLLLDGQTTRSLRGTILSRRVTQARYMKDADVVEWHHQVKLI
jgi:hypothetical protein